MLTDKDLDQTITFVRYPSISRSNEDLIEVIRQEIPKYQFVIMDDSFTSPPKNVSNEQTDYLKSFFGDCYGGYSRDEQSDYTEMFSDVISNNPHVFTIERVLYQLKKVNLGPARFERQKKACGRIRSLLQSRELPFNKQLMDNYKHILKELRSIQRYARISDVNYEILCTGINASVLGDTAILSNDSKLNKTIVLYNIQEKNVPRHTFLRQSYNLRVITTLKEFV